MHQRKGCNIGSTELSSSDRRLPMVYCATFYEDLSVVVRLSRTSGRKWPFSLCCSFSVSRNAGLDGCPKLNILSLGHNQIRDLMQASWNKARDPQSA
eukprot:661489-Amphidinium_carterae.3